MLVGLLPACATTQGPEAIMVATAEIEWRIQAGFEGVLEIFKGIDARRPEASLMRASERLQFEWLSKLPDGPTSWPLEVAVATRGQ
jgi:hypothetical protein